MLTSVKPSVRISTLHQNVFFLHNLMCAERITDQHDEFGPLILRTGVLVLMETFKCS